MRFARFIIVTLGLGIMSCWSVVFCLELVTGKSLTTYCSPKVAV